MAGEHNIIIMKTMLVQYECRDFSVRHETVKGSVLTTSLHKNNSYLPMFRIDALTNEDRTLLC